MVTKYIIKEGEKLMYDVLDLAMKLWERPNSVVELATRVEELMEKCVLRNRCLELRHSQYGYLMIKSLQSKGLLIWHSATNPQERTSLTAPTVEELIELIERDSSLQKLLSTPLNSAMRRELELKEGVDLGIADYNIGKKRC